MDTTTANVNAKPDEDRLLHEMLHEIVGPAPPTWVRIGIVGSPNCGKQWIIPALAGTYSNGLGDFGATPLESDCGSSDALDATLVAALDDARRTVLERRSFSGDAPLPHSTSVQLRLMSQPQVPASPGSVFGTAAGSCSPATPPPAPAPQSAEVHVEVVECWCHMAHPVDDGDDGSPLVLMKDDDLVLSDAFLVVFDATDDASLLACEALLGFLVGEARGGGGGAPAGPLLHRQRAVVAVLAVATQTTGVSPKPRCASEETCRLLGTRFGVPVFEIAAFHEHRLRRVLEKIITRITKA